MKFFASNCVALALAFLSVSVQATSASCEEYSINNFTTFNVQLDQVTSISFLVGSPATGKTVTQCAGSVPFNPSTKSNATASGQVYNCTNKAFRFLYDEGDYKGKRSVLRLFHSVQKPTVFAGNVHFPTPQCEITPFMYICNANANYTITLEA